MKLNCPKCGTEILSENMNLDRMIAKCNRCHSVFSFADRLDTPTTPAKLDAPQPEKVRVENSGTDLTLHWRWFSWYIVPMTLFALFWNGIILFGFGGAFFFADSGELPSFASLLPLLILPHFWVGLALIYYVLTGYLNKTVVTVNYGQLSVQHGPLPWWGNKRYEPSHIVQLYTKENRSRFRRNTWSGSFEVHVILKKGTHQKLLSGLDSSEHGLFVEQALETYLNITDHAVRGEYGR
ncbi:hypothetical protein [Candidatus Leptofilum sp.]|uniref:hypothetical protein n=1 Tax=Candidatus Leptofilum sp. TaxID=3241576 RepID=UPI003B5CBC83